MAGAGHAIPVRSLVRLRWNHLLACLCGCDTRLSQITRDITSIKGHTVGEESAKLTELCPSYSLFHRVAMPRRPAINRLPVQGCSHILQPRSCLPANHNGKSKPQK